MSREFERWGRGERGVGCVDGWKNRSRRRKGIWEIERKKKGRRQGGCRYGFEPLWGADGLAGVMRQPKLM